MAQSGAQWITTTEAAQRLGVKRATLYAYVSRGLLRSVRRPGQQESLFDRGQIDALASSSRAAGSPQPVLRFRSIATSVSSQVDGDLRYRGTPLDDVVASSSLEAAASLVLGLGATARKADSRDEVARVRPRSSALVRLLAGLPLERRLPVTVQVLAASDPFADDTDPDRARTATLGTMRRSVALLAQVAGASDFEVDDLASLSFTALRGRTGSPAEVEVMRVLLISLLDHGLTASTVAARVAASTRAGIHACLTAAYAAMSGPLHGAAPVAAHALLGDPGPAEHAVRRALREHGLVPGFGHFIYDLYPDGDPRADIVLTALWELPGTAPLRRRIDELADVVAGHTARRPNIDLASAAVLHALGLPAAAGEVVFQIARSFGVVAHAIEEYAEEPLRWRGREAVG